MEAKRGRAVVIGASMGGLLAARVLAENHGRVVVVERDALPDEAGPRRGVPQGRHTHGLLARGREVLEELLPGLTAELVAQGAVPGDILGGIRWYHDGHHLRQVPSSLQGLLVSRPLLERQVRRRVAAVPNVEILDRWSVSGLLTTPGSDGIEGVTGSGADGIERTITADLVVDASGRASRSPAWLEQLGYPVPREDKVDAALTYATCSFRRRPDDLDGDMGVLMAPLPPRGRAGVLIAQEDDRWIATLGGYGDDRPPTDEAGWLAYAESLPHPDIAEVVRRAEPLGPVVPYRYPASVRRRYERLHRFPRGYLVFGDALCSFNPLYGQGMTVAALEALALRDQMRSGEVDARRFFRAAARLIDVPWDIVVGSDLRFEQVPGRQTARIRFVNRYLARLHRAAVHDPVLALAFLRVVNLIDLPTRLMRPGIARRVLFPRRVRRLRATPRPVATSAAEAVAATATSGATTPPADAGTRGAVPASPAPAAAVGDR